MHELHYWCALFECITCAINTYAYICNKYANKTKPNTNFVNTEANCSGTFVKNASSFIVFNDEMITRNCLLTNEGKNTS